QNNDRPEGFGGNGMPRLAAVACGLPLRCRAPHSSVLGQDTNMDNLLSDLRYAFRSMLQRPGFTLAALLTLALGIGATTAMFSVVQGVLLRPLPYDKIERLAIFGQGQRLGDPDQISTISVANFIDWRDQSSSFESMALYSRAQITLTGFGDAETIAGAQVTPDFFRVLGAEPMIGRTFTDDE